MEVRKQADQVMGQLAEYVDIAIANEEDVQKSLGITSEVRVESGQLDLAAYQSLSSRVLERTPI